MKKYGAIIAIDSQQQYFQLREDLLNEQSKLMEFDSEEECIRGIESAMEKLNIKTYFYGAHVLK